MRKFLIGLVILLLVGTNLFFLMELRNTRDINENLKENRSSLNEEMSTQNERISNLREENSQLRDERERLENNLDLTKLAVFIGGVSTKYDAKDYVSIIVKNSGGSLTEDHLYTCETKLQILDTEPTITAGNFYDVEEKRNLSFSGRITGLEENETRIWTREIDLSQNSDFRIQPKSCNVRKASQ